MGDIIVSVSVQWIAIAILFFLLVYSTMQKPSEMQKHITVLIIAAMLFMGGYLIRLESTNIETAMLGAGITYIGQPFVMLSSFMLICTFYGRKIPNWLFAIMAVYAAAVPFIVFSNESHYLFYATVEFDPDALYSPLITTHGPLYNVNLVSVVSYFVGYIFVIFSGNRQSSSPTKRRLSVYSILMALFGMLGYVFYFLKLTKGYDTTMLGVSIGVIFLYNLFFRCRIFDIVDKAKDYALDISSEGLVVFGDSYEIIYRNGTAEHLMEQDIPLDCIKELPPGENTLTRDDRHYSLRVNNITKGDDYLGKSVEIHDISDSVNYQSQLEQAVSETTERLETIQRTIFGSMASIVEARSLETGDHIKRVSRYTEMIACSLRDMGKHSDILTDSYISTLVLSAPLHDIGKISISDTILLKPGKLTPEEFEIMKTHSQKGAEIITTTMEGLESEEYTTMASNSAMYHHEWWNGKGYPAGLKGEEIPLCARIVALADCYDAMTSKRCYKDAFPDEQALSIIREESGTHFDPDVVEAFLRCETR